MKKVSNIFYPFELSKKCFIEIETLTSICSVLVQSKEVIGKVSKWGIDGLIACFAEIN